MDRNDIAVARAEHAPVNNNAQGWVTAALVVLLAIGCAAGAWYIHNETYRSPNDPAAPVGTHETEPHG